jgi:hypothetical protein
VGHDFLMHSVMRGLSLPELVRPGSLDTFGNEILHPPKSMVISRGMSDPSNPSASDDPEDPEGDGRLEKRIQLTQTNRAYHQVMSS